MVLAHRDVARYLLAERLDLLDVLLQSLAYLQGMNAYQRKTDEHVQWSSQSWQHSVSLELNLLMLVGLPFMRITRPNLHTCECWLAVCTSLPSGCVRFPLLASWSVLSSSAHELTSAEQMHAPRWSIC